MATGSESLVWHLRHADITICFANPGTTEMHIADVLSGTPGMRTVLTLHESVATAAADGFARMARSPAMTLLHLGPGLANGLANLHHAQRAGTPMVNIIGTMASWHQAEDAPLSMDAAALADTVSNGGSSLGCIRACAGRASLDACLQAAFEHLVDTKSHGVRPGASRVATLLIAHVRTRAATVELRCPNVSLVA